MTPELETPRLLLRPLELADAAETQILFPQWEIVRYLANTSLGPIRQMARTPIIGMLPCQPSNVEMPGIGHCASKVLHAA